MEKKIRLLDGAAGTVLWKLAGERGIDRLSTWRYNIENPELVLELHREYIDAGSEYIQTNTFTANPLAVARESGYKAEAVISRAVELALKAAEGTGAAPYLSFGPPTALLEPFGTLKAGELYDMYALMVRAGAEAGAGMVMLETFMDVRMMEIAAKAAVNCGIPVICSMTFEKRRRTMMGDTVQKIVDTLEPLGIAGIGMNCSHGPVQALEIIREFSEKTSLPLYYKPNSGMGENYSAEQFAREVAPALDIVTYVGGCCGCDADYIRALRKVL